MRLLKVETIISELKERSDPKARAGMARFGIQTNSAFGVSVTELRRIAKRIGTNHELALELWKTGIHEARILASMIDDEAKVTEVQMENWASDFDSWDVVDGCCGNLFDKTRFAVSKASEWTGREEEYVKRAGFVLIAEMAVHDKNAEDSTFEKFLPLIERNATDNRNFVKKAVNWALRQIGKRNLVLNRAAIRTTERIQELDSKAARWIAADALRELKSANVRKKLRTSSAGSQIDRCESSRTRVRESSRKNRSSS